MIVALLKAGAYFSGGRVKEGLMPLHSAARAGRYVNQYRYTGQSYFELLTTIAC